MAFKSSALIILSIFLFSCGQKHDADNAVLKIIFSKDKAEQLHNKYVYLVDVSKRKIMDSALTKGDTVIFSNNWSAGFVPYMVSVQQIDTFQGHLYLRPFGIQSPYNAKYIYSWFYLDKGLTILKPYMMDYDNTQTDFTGSKQNEPYFKHIELQYAGEDSIQRQAIINKNISKIKAYPYSIYLLEQLFSFKEKFLNGDLKEQLSFFNDDVKKTPLFKRFTDYFDLSSTYDKAFPQIELESQNGDYQKIGNDSTAYYLIVYWASWCAPCRKEIPDLKALYKKFAGKGLTITSISLDEDKRNWQTALEKEKMPWQQLIAIDSTKTFIDLHYNIKAIPKAYLFNRKKELIKTFDDGFIMMKGINTLFASDDVSIKDYDRK